MPDDGLTWILPYLGRVDRSPGGATGLFGASRQEPRRGDRFIAWGVSPRVWVVLLESALEGRQTSAAA